MVEWNKAAPNEVVIEFIFSLEWYLECPTPENGEPGTRTVELTAHIGIDVDARATLTLIRNP